MKTRIFQWVFAGLLSLLALPAFSATDAADTRPTPESGTHAGGSALPPGTNPTTPSGGNGGDAAGYDHMPKPGEGARVDKTIDDNGREKRGDDKGNSSPGGSTGSDTR